MAAHEPLADVTQRQAEVDGVLARARELAASFAQLARSYEGERDMAVRAGLDRGLPLYQHGLGLLRDCCRQLASSGLLGEAASDAMAYSNGSDGDVRGARCIAQLRDCDVSSCLGFDGRCGVWDLGCRWERGTAGHMQVPVRSMVLASTWSGVTHALSTVG